MNAVLLKETETIKSIEVSPGLSDVLDDDLIKRTLAGDRRSYEHIVKRYQKIVYNTAYQILRSKESAADVTQDTFIRAYQALPGFREGASLKPWLLRIATNRALNFLRDHKDYSPIEDVSEGALASKENVESEVESALIRERLQIVLKAMEPLHRSIFLLRYQYDLSYEEIGKIVDLSLSSVKSQLFRIKARIRALFDEDMFEQSKSKSDSSEEINHDG